MAIAGFGAAAASVAAPVVLDRMGLHSPGTEIALSMAANAFLGHQYEPVSRMEKLLSDKIAAKKVDGRIADIYEHKAGKAVLASMLARETATSAETIITQKDKHVPEVPSLLLQALISRKIEAGIPAAVARLDAAKEYDELQALAQQKRESFGEEVKAKGLRAADLASGVLVGVLVHGAGDLVFGESGWRGIFGTGDDAAAGVLAMRRMFKK